MVLVTTSGIKYKRPKHKRCFWVFIATCLPCRSFLIYRLWSWWMHGGYKYNISFIFCVFYTVGQLNTKASRKMWVLLQNFSVYLVRRFLNWLTNLVLLCKRIRRSMVPHLFAAFRHLYSPGQYCEMPLARFSADRSQNNQPLMIRPLCPFARELLQFIRTVGRN